MLVGEVNAHLRTLGEHARAEDALGIALHAASEQHRHRGWSANADVVGHQGLEQGACSSRCVEHDGAGDLDLTHAELPPVASLAIGACERTGDADNPIVEECLELGRTESITDGLQPAWVFAVRKAIGQLGKGEAFASGLTFGPIVPVDPHLQRVREIAANLDEAQPERWVEDIKVVHRHSAIGFVEAELWSVLLGASPIAHEHLLDLLGDDDGHHSGCGGLVDVFAYVIDLAVIPARPIRRVEMQHWDAIDVGEAPHGIAETITNLLEQGG